MEIQRQEMLLDGCRRLGIDRRNYGYDAYLPERRNLKERRNGVDRRKDDLGSSSGSERRVSEE